MTRFLNLWLPWRPLSISQSNFIGLGLTGGVLTKIVGLLNRIVLSLDPLRLDLLMTLSHLLPSNLVPRFVHYCMWSVLGLLEFFLHHLGQRDCCRIIVVVYGCAGTQLYGSHYGNCWTKGATRADRVFPDLTSPITKLLRHSRLLIGFFRKVTHIVDTFLDVVFIWRLGSSCWFGAYMTTFFVIWNLTAS